MGFKDRGDYCTLALRFWAFVSFFDEYAEGSLRAFNAPRSTWNAPRMFFDAIRHGRDSLLDFFGIWVPRRTHYSGFNQQAKILALRFTKPLRPRGSCTFPEARIIESKSQSPKPKLISIHLGCDREWKTICPYGPPLYSFVGLFWVSMLVWRMLKFEHVAVIVAITKPHAA